MKLSLSTSFLFLLSVGNQHFNLSVNASPTRSIAGVRGGAIARGAASVTDAATKHEPVGTTMQHGLLPYGDGGDVPSRDLLQATPPAYSGNYKILLAMSDRPMFRNDDRTVTTMPNWKDEPKYDKWKIDTIPCPSSSTGQSSNNFTMYTNDVCVNLISPRNTALSLQATPDGAWGEGVGMSRQNTGNDVLVAQSFVDVWNDLTTDRQDEVRTHNKFADLESACPSIDDTNTIDTDDCKVLTLFSGAGRRIYYFRTNFVDDVETGFGASVPSVEENFHPGYVWAITSYN